MPFASMINGKLFIISGPAGVGKSTVCKNLLALTSDKILKRVITVTTRKPRPNEVHAEDYQFVSEQYFENCIRENLLLEYATVYGKARYGTPKEFVIQSLLKGIHLLLVIDVQGMVGVKENIPPELLPNVITVFILPESIDTVIGRLEHRNSEFGDELEQRIMSAKNEITIAKEYDYNLISGSEFEDLLSLKKIYEIETCA
ncbi:MAG: guanylate kinase [Puniceicoccales bacterium]|jgi:guanylate kinase|nr:guanylate kinase [Puniceicoccales bacterium]